MNKLVFWLLVVPALFVVLVAGAMGLRLLFGPLIGVLISVLWGMLIGMLSIYIYGEKVRS